MWTNLWPKWAGKVKALNYFNLSLESASQQEGADLQVTAATMRNLPIDIFNDANNSCVPVCFTGDIVAAFCLAVNEADVAVLAPV